MMTPMIKDFGGQGRIRCGEGGGHFRGIFRQNKEAVLTFSFKAKSEGGVLACTQTLVRRSEKEKTVRFLLLFTPPHYSPFRSSALL